LGISIPAKVEKVFIATFGGVKSGFACVVPQAEFLSIHFFNGDYFGNCCFHGVGIAPGSNRRGVG